MLGLRFCARDYFSSCGKWGPLFIAVRGPLTIVASLVEEHRLQTRRLSSVAHGLCRSAACGIFPDQGSNPCPLHWQADSQPLRHQGSPETSSLTIRHFASFLLLLEIIFPFHFPHRILSWCNTLIFLCLTVFYWSVSHISQQQNMYANLFKICLL